MAHACCPACRVRFTTMSVADLAACPQCGQSLKSIGSQQAFWFRWLEVPDPIPRMAVFESRAHESATTRLDAALQEWARLADDVEQAKGSRREADTVYDFSAARAEVATREAWLSWVELLESDRPLAVQPAKVIVPRPPLSPGHAAANGPLRAPAGRFSRPPKGE